ncbi:MAG: hypothetical protein JKY43_09575 [Phycisphaerales bacterium]|nr:hypothetical protein [Phycisphaerales bacterium]
MNKQPTEKDIGKSDIAIKLLDAISEILEIKNDQVLASALGVKQSSIYQWRNNKSAPTKNSLKKIVSHMMCGWVDPVYEIHPISPVMVGKSWSIHQHKQKRDEFRKTLDSRHGVYIFYDSSGSVSYIGKSKKNLFIEIEQQLNHKLLHTTYIGTGSQPVATQLVQGEITHYMSVYTTLVPEAVHNLEAIFLRSIPNDNNNRNLARFRFGTVEDWKV